MAVTSCFVRTLSSLLANRAVVLYNFAFTHASPNLTPLSDRSLTDENIFAGVVATDETVSVIDVKGFKGDEYLLISATAQVGKAVLVFPTLSRGVPTLSYGVHQMSSRSGCSRRAGSYMRHSLIHSSPHGSARISRLCSSRS